MPKRAIGVFDSGVGGLTVLRAIAELIPGEDLVYLGDTARVPYGTKGAETVTRYALEASAFLSRYDVKMIVVACNTASAVALPSIAASTGLPVVGVIEPGARGAVARSANGTIGVIGTEGTIRSGAYERAIQQLRPDARVATAACPLFVSLVEEGWHDHPVAHMTAAEYLAPLQNSGIDTLVLGCTHYPLLKKTLGEVLGDGVALVDSAAETARSVKAELARLGLLNPEPTRRVRYCVTDASERFSRVGGAFLGTTGLTVERVSLTDS